MLLAEQPLYDYIYEEPIPVSYTHLDVYKRQNYIYQNSTYLFSLF